MHCRTTHCAMSVVVNILEGHHLETCYYWKFLSKLDKRANACAGGTEKQLIASSTECLACGLSRQKQRRQRWRRLQRSDLQQAFAQLCGGLRGRCAEERTRRRSRPYQQCRRHCPRHHRPAREIRVGVDRQARDSLRLCHGRMDQPPAGGVDRAPLWRALQQQLPGRMAPGARTPAAIGPAAIGRASARNGRKAVCTLLVAARDAQARPPDAGAGTAKALSKALVAMYRLIKWIMSARPLRPKAFSACA